MLAPDVEVLAERGPVPARSIREGEALCVHGPEGRAIRPARVMGYRAAPPELIRITTSADRVLTVTPDHPVFMRFGPGAAPWDVVLCREVGVGAALLCGRGGLRDLGDRRYSYTRCPPGDPATEEVYLLGSFPSQREARYHLKLWGARYGLPETTGGYRDLSHEDWRRLFLDVDTLGNAFELLRDLDLDPDLPHWTRRTLDAGGLRRHLLVEAVEKGEGFDVRIRRPQVHAGRPRGERLPRDPLRVADLASYQGLEHVDVDRRVDLGGRHVYRRQVAAALRPGMLVPVLEQGRVGEDRVVAAGRVPGDGLVYRVGAAAAAALLVQDFMIPGEGTDPGAPDSSGPPAPGSRRTPA